MPPAQDVRPERREALVKSRTPLGDQLERRAVELHDLDVADAHHEPRAPAGAPPPASWRIDAPRADHPQVGVEREAAVEAEQQVLAARVDPFDPPIRQPLTPPVTAEAHVRADLVRDLALEHRPQPVGVPGDRVSLGHRRRLRSGAEGQPPRSLLEAVRDQRRSQRRGERRLAVDPLEREPLDPAAPHVLHQRDERRLEPVVARPARASAAPGRRARGRASGRLR